MGAPHLSRCLPSYGLQGILLRRNGMKNFAVQLKIIAAVKAAAGDGDAAAENQLVTCCQGARVKATDAAFFSGSIARVEVTSGRVLRAVDCARRPAAGTSPSFTRAAATRVAWLGAFESTVGR